MFEQVLPGNTKKILALLGKKDFLPPKTYLAGGTAVALQLCHRISYDLDFFTPQKFNTDGILSRLKTIKGFKLERSDWQTILGHFPDCKFSLFYYPYPLIGKPKDYLGIKIVSLEDLAAAKLNSIASRGTKRDFADLYYLIPKVGSLEKIFVLYDKKYGNLAVNRAHLQKSLNYFVDADKDREPQMLAKDYSWPKIKEYFKKEVLKLAKNL